MIYTTEQYRNAFKFRDKKVSLSTIQRRCNKGMLPAGHTSTQLPGKRGQWIIEVFEKVEKK